MQSKAKTVDEYIASLPEDRQEAITAVRKVILKNLPKGYQEIMQWGMIGYVVPHSSYLAGYHAQPKEPLPYASLASQKNHMAFYGMGIYLDEAQRQWFVDAWKKTGKKLDMGKSCVRFKKLEDVPLEVIGQAVKRFPMKEYIAAYEKTLVQTRAGKKVSAKRSAARKKTAKEK
jgi:hypothetical protein